MIRKRLKLKKSRLTLKIGTQLLQQIGVWEEQIGDLIQKIFKIRENMMKERSSLLLVRHRTTSKIISKTTNGNNNRIRFLQSKIDNRDGNLVVVPHLLQHMGDSYFDYF